MVPMGHRSRQRGVERWLSGRRRFFAKELNGIPVPQVRILSFPRVLIYIYNFIKSKIWSILSYHKEVRDKFWKSFCLFGSLLTRASPVLGMHRLRLVPLGTYRNWGDKATASKPLPCYPRPSSRQGENWIKGRSKFLREALMGVIIAWPLVRRRPNGTIHRRYRFKIP